jgi:excisionase family DNA binding protein
MGEVGFSSMTASERLERARRLAAETGIPLAGVDRLAVSPRIAARLLSLSLSMVEKLIARGDIPAFHAGRVVRVELVDLVEFMERNRKVPRAGEDGPLRERAVALIESRS